MPNEEGICRACLGTRHSDVSQLESLFEPPLPGKLSLPQMLEKVAIVQVVENDGLPSVICIQCKKSIYNAFSFKQLCETSDAKLRGHISNPETKIIKDFDELKETDDLICDSIETQLDVQPLSAIPFNVKDEFGQDANIPDIVNKNIDETPTLSSYLNFKQLDNKFDIKKEDFNIKSESKSTLDDEILFLSIEKSGKHETKEKSLNIVVKSLQDIVGPTHPCTECDKRFFTNKGLKRHIKLCHKKETKRLTETDSNITCKICNQTFACKQTLTRHKKTHQENLKNKLCTFCGKGFLRADDLKRHIRIHTGERPYACQLCPKKYKQSSELKDHMKSHSDASYVCTECGKSLASRNGLYVHMKVHRGEKNWQCKFCVKKFVTNGELNSHISHIHSKEKPYLCLYTGCTRAFTTNLSLQTHMRAHSGDRLFKCTDCGKCLSTSSSLHEHKRIHTGEKPKKCNICERRLGNSQALKKHMRLHTGERPYQCKTCLQKFICASTLNAHIKKKHMDKQFKCNLCQKMFALATKLKLHMRVHENNKYKCDSCIMSFSVKSKLLHHIQKEHSSTDLGYNLTMENSQGQVSKPPRIIRTSQISQTTQVPLLFQNSQVPSMFQAPQISNIITPTAEINMPSTLNQESQYLKVQCTKVQYVYMS